MISCLHKSLDNYYSQALAFRQVLMGYPIDRLYVSLTLPLKKIVAISIFMNFIYLFMHSPYNLFIYARKKTIPHYYSSQAHANSLILLVIDASTLHGCHKSFTTFIVSKIQ